jgi:hypothetical protein
MHELEEYSQYLMHLDILIVCEEKCFSEFMSWMINERIRLSNSGDEEPPVKFGLS